MNLDATITVHFETDLSGKKIVLEGITLAMHGPNPEPFDPSREYKGVSKGTRGYWEGIHYGSISLTIPKAIAIAEYSKKEISNLNVSGLDAILKIMTDKLLETANDGFKKTSKPSRPSR
ncbi:MAG: hypothetical protein HRT61_05440 [Ekhidna sp.]|nr:hypothetical protein [Ekhidna sp.]